MRRIRLRYATLASTFVIAFLVVDVAQANAALPKLKCAKIGQETTVNTSKFICQKKAGKFTWVIKPVVSSPKVKDIDPLLQRVNLALAAQLPQGTLGSVDESLIGKIVAEPGLPTGDITETKRVLKQIYLAQPILNLANPPVAILAKSESFIKEQFPIYCKEPISWYPNQNTTMAKWENWAFVGCLHSTPVQVVPLPPTGVPITHIEGALGSDLGYLPIGISDNMAKLPTWFVRGLKGVIGEYSMSIGDTSWHVPYMGVENCLSAKLSDISYSYVEINKNKCEVLGAAASRYMVSLKGLAPTIAFINQLQVTGIWSEQTFSDFLGIPFSQFESETKAYAKLLPRS